MLRSCMQWWACACGGQGCLPLPFPQPTQPYARATQPQPHLSSCSAVGGLVGGRCFGAGGSLMPYTRPSCSRPQRLATTSTGCRMSVRRSMGTTPAATMSARLLAYLGITRPGQSHSTQSGLTCSVWKCLVLPASVTRGQTVWGYRVVLKPLGHQSRLCRPNLTPVLGDPAPHPFPSVCATLVWRAALLRPH